MLEPFSSDATLRFLETSLDLLSIRHSLIAGNIANVDTPGYKAVDLDFESELRVSIERRRSLETGRQGGTLRYEQVLKPRVVEVRNARPRLDGNTVNVDEEMGKLARTTSQYTQALKMMGIKLRMIKAAIRD